MVLSFIISFVLFFTMQQEQNQIPDCVTGPTNIVSPVYEIGFGIVISDYKTGKPLKLTWKNVIPPSGDTKTDIPVVFANSTAGDFGNISAILKGSCDTLFTGNWVWMGNGSVKKPESFLEAKTSPGPELNNPDPYVFTVFDEAGNITTDSLMITSAKKAWKKAVNTDQITGYLAPSFRLGAFLYTPARGKTNWDAARWVFFIFRD